MVRSDHSINKSIIFPKLNYVLGRNDKAFTKGIEEYNISNGPFEIVKESICYDMYDFKYSRDFMPVLINTADAIATSKTIEINIAKDKFKFDFHRDSLTFHILFAFGEIVVE